MTSTDKAFLVAIYWASGRDCHTDVSPEQVMGYLTYLVKEGEQIVFELVEEEMIALQIRGLVEVIEVEGVAPEYRIRQAGINYVEDAERGFITES